MSNLFPRVALMSLLWHNGLPYCDSSNKPYCDVEKERARLQRIFLQDNDLISRWKAMVNEDSFTMAEINFGAGIHFISTWFYWLQHAPKNARLHYIACTNKPFSREDIRLILALWPEFEREAQLFIADYPVLTPGFHQLVFENGRINLTFMLGDTSFCFKQLLHCGDAVLEKRLRSACVDSWFIHDDMLSDELFQSIAMLSRAGTTLTGHSNSDDINTQLKKVGFEVINDHTTFIQSTKNHKIRQTPWHTHVTTRVQTKQAIVIGAGLAGCLTASALANRGWQIFLVDSAGEIAAGASGNPQAILYPKLSAFDSPLTAFMLSAYLYASRFYSKILKKSPIGELSGILQLAYNSREMALQQGMFEWLALYPELGKLVNANQASHLSGVSQRYGGLYLPLSGWLDCKALCQFLIQTSGIHLITNHPVETLNYDNGLWSIGGEYRSETVVITSGYQANQFEQTAHLPLKAIAGLLSSIRSNEQTEQLKIPLCGEGHILPARGGVHVFGATYHPDASFISDHQADNLENLAKLQGMNNEHFFGQDVMDNWSGTRGAVTDYLPLVGPAPDSDLFEQTFKSLATDSRRWIPHAGDYYPGLYLCAGFGSRGLTSVPLAAEWLASIINNEPSFLPHRIVQAISPSRFLIKKIIRNNKG